MLHIKFNGAGDRNRTNNLLITSQLLYLLSYTSILVLMLDNKQHQKYLNTNVQKDKGRIVLFYA